jgi:hypothetical protein
MLRIVFAILLVGSLSMGCSHAYYIRSLDSDEYRAFDQRAAKKPCSLVLDDGTEYTAEKVKLSEDTTSWVAASTGQQIQVPTDRVRRIVFRSRSDGLVEGAALGFAAAGLAGAVWGWSEGEDSCGDGSEICFTHGQSLVLGLFVFGIPGAILGAIGGAGHGTTYVYYPFPDEPIVGPDDFGGWDSR